MTNATMTWKIDPELSLQKLNSGIRNKALRIALNAGAAPVKSTLIATVPKDEGHLAKAIIIKVKNYKANNSWVAIVGAGSKYKRLKKNAKGKVVRRVNKKGEKVKAYIKPSRYQHLVNTGSKYIRGRRFIQASFNAAKNAFQARATAKLKETIEQLMKSK